MLDLSEYSDLSAGETFLAVVVGLLAAFVVHVTIKLLQSAIPFRPTVNKVLEAYPGALTNKELSATIIRHLDKYGYGDDTLVATSLCCDEVNRPLEKELKALYGGDYFAMGGLAGFPFGGVTSFGAMAHHIPDGGSCLIVYGPHVGIDSDGKVGTVERRGRAKSGACCGSGVAASGYVAKVTAGETCKVCPPDSPLDAQQTFVGNMLLPHGRRLAAAEDPMIELPMALFDVQDEMMQKIVQKGCREVAGNGKIALLGGIQINTPAGVTDYFLPLRFDVLNNTGDRLERILDMPNRATVSKIASAFPNALTNVELIQTITNKLAPFGYGKTSLLATSLCCDEVNRPLENDLKMAFSDHFNMGGLAGFAFGGVTGFCAMAHHIPDNGSCLVVYGPHVGVDSEGRVGTVNRRGRSSGGSCCGSGVAAAVYVRSVASGAEPAKPPTDPLDAQQSYVGSMLLPYSGRLEAAAEPMVELPYSLYEAQDELMQKIVAAGACHVAGRGKIALLGGIQINTPDGLSDYFLPLRFDVVGNNGKTIENLLSEDRVAMRS